MHRENENFDLYFKKDVNEKEEMERKRASLSFLRKTRNFQQKKKKKKKIGHGSNLFLLKFTST